MGRAQARVARADQYLSVPKRGRPDLRVVEGGAEPGFAPARERDAVRSLRPDWLPEDLAMPGEAFAAPGLREAAPAGAGRAAREAAVLPPAPAEQAPVEPVRGPAPRRTVVVSGRPEDDLRFEAHGKKVRRRRSPTAARLAGRPDRVAGWAVALGIVMALMAGATAGSEPKTAGDAVPAPAAIR